MTDEDLREANASIRKKAEAQYAQLLDAIEDAGMTVAECMCCGCIVVSVPDGLFLCGACAEKEG